MSGLSPKADLVAYLFGHTAFCCTDETRPKVMASMEELVDKLDAAAHARGVAEERARWTAGLTRKSESWHEKYHGLLRVTWAQCKTYTCMKDRSILAAMAPSSPQDDRGGPEGSAGV